jgi:type III secretion system (T3SS) inner membrane Yop/YscD-like protein
VTDQKKFDPDKTAVDIPPAGSAPAAPPDEGDKTVMMQRPAVLASRPAPADADKTMVGSALPAREPRDADKTMVGGMAPAAAAGPVNFELVCLAGSARGRKFPLRGEQTLVGSSSSCQVVLSGIESVHVRLHETADGVELQNLGTAGSVVVSGGRSPERVKIKSGDLIKVGETVLRLVRAGDVFSSEYSEADLTGSFIGRFLDPQALKANWRRLAIGGLVVVAVGVLLSSPVVRTGGGPATTAGPSASDLARQKQVDSLLQSGETLFNAGKFVAPPDRPEAENAYAKFDKVLSLDPGNEKARDWMTKIDGKLKEDQDKQKVDEQKRAEALRKQREAERAALEAEVKKYVDQGDALFNAGQVAEPAGRNALVYYREALKRDPQSALAREKEQKAIYYYVDNGDKFRDAGDLWKALEQYRKASRTTEGKDTEIEARVRETETQLRGGTTTDSYLVIYKDERGQTVVFDDMSKVPARYRDRAVEVRPGDSLKKPQ